VTPPGGIAAPRVGVTMSPTKDELIRHARTKLDGWIGPNKIVRLVLRFMDCEPQGDWDLFDQYLANEVQTSPESKRAAAKLADEMNPEHARIFPYRDDPVGEDAVRHVMRERGSG
jgi:hypothetical protein